MPLESQPESFMRDALPISLSLFLSLAAIDAVSLAAPAPQKPRTIVTTDGEVDDMDSFTRFLLYTNDVDVVGLVYSSSQWHYAGDGKGTLFTSQMASTAKRYGERTDLRWAGTEWMQALIGKYAAVHSNLLKHDRAYPSPAYLRSLVKVGNIEFEGSPRTSASTMARCSRSISCGATGGRSREIPSTPREIPSRRVVSSGHSTTSSRRAIHRRTSSCSISVCAAWRIPRSAGSAGGS